MSEPETVEQFRLKLQKKFGSQRHKLFLFVAGNYGRTGNVTVSGRDVEGERNKRIQGLCRAIGGTKGPNQTFSQNLSNLLNQTFEKFAHLYY